MASFVSLTTDMGTEMGMADFRYKLSEIMPPWRMQAFQPLMVDRDVAFATNGGGARSNDVQINHLDADSSAVVSTGQQDGLQAEGCGMEPLEADSWSGCDAARGGLSNSSFDDVAADAGRDVSMEAEDDRRQGCDAYSRFLPFAMSVPGALHILSNLQRDVDHQLQEWDSFWPQVHNLAALVCTPLVAEAS